MSDDVTTTGHALFEAWRVATQRLARVKAAISTAQADHDTAADALARWLLPDDAQPGETIGIRRNNQLITATLASGDQPSTIVVRPLSPPAP